MLYSNKKRNSRIDPRLTVTQLGNSYVSATLAWRQRVVRGIGITSDEAVARLRLLAGLQLSSADREVLRGYD